MKMSSGRFSLAVVSLAVALACGCGTGSDTDSQPTEDWASHDGGEESNDGQVFPDKDGVEGEPDGGSDGSGGLYPGKPKNNTCSDEHTALFSLDDVAPDRLDVPPLPFEIVDGPEVGSDNYPLEGTFQGVVSLDSTVSFECPSQTADPGVSCATDRAVAIEYQADGETRTLRLALGLPYDDIDWPSTGTDVEVAFQSRQYGTNPDFLTLRTTSDQTAVVGLGRARSDQPDNGDPVGQEYFSRDHGAFELGMPDDIDDRETAICLETDRCGRVLRLEPLVLTASGTDTEMSVGETANVSGADSSYRIWHAASFRRNSDFEGVSCADLRPAKSIYGFARMN
jgi:hypothetical protein